MKTLYYFYRLSRGPLTTSGAESGFPLAEAVVGKVATSTSSCGISASTGVPCGLKRETLPSPRSFYFYYGQGSLQVDSSGDVFQGALPYSTPGMQASGTIVLQWYNPGTGKFTELASEVVSDNALTFAVDSSGNVYWSTSAGAVMEIPRV